MGYGNWTEIKITNTSAVDIQFTNSALTWGKFYSCEPSGRLFGTLYMSMLTDAPIANKDAEIQPGDLNNTTISAGKTYTIGACGRENTWSGTDGQFDLHAPSLGLTVAKITFYSPYGASYNNFHIDSPNPGQWMSTSNGGNLTNNGPLGSITVTVKKIDA